MRTRFHKVRPSEVVFAVVFAIVLGVLSGCGVPISEVPVDAGAKVGSPTTALENDGNGALPVRIFFLRNGRFDWVERRDTASSAAHPEFAIRNTIESLKAGLLPRERQRGFSSPLDSIVADTDLALAVTVSNGIAEIDLSSMSGVLRTLSVKQRELVVSQLALTSLLATPGIGGVRFILDGDYLTLSNQSGSLGPEYHVNDFSCLAEDLTCSLPAVSMPPVEGAAESGLVVGP
jgi:hypothetical protein